MQTRTARDGGLVASARRGRQVRRRSAGGFTLIELMVVVVLIAILAMVAVPSMMVAREDRLAFRTADTFARLIHGGQTRSGRGAAQLVLISADGLLDRGSVITFESLTPTGQPVGSCKNFDQWLAVLNSPPGGVTTPVIAFENTNAGATSMQVRSGLESTLLVTGVATKVAAICFSAGGSVFVTTGSDITSAIGLLPTAQPFTGDIVMRVVRKPGGGPVNGLTREVIMTPNGALRIRSI